MREPARRRRRVQPGPRRCGVVGAAAIALAASLVIENAVVFAGAPSYGAPIKEVLAYHAEHRGSVSIAVGLQALYQLRELVNRYEQLAAATMDAQQRTASDIAEVRARTAAIDRFPHGRVANQ